MSSNNTSQSTQCPEPEPEHRAQEAIRPALRGSYLFSIGLLIHFSPQVAQDFYIISNRVSSYNDFYIKSVSTAVAANGFDYKISRRPQDFSLSLLVFYRIAYTYVYIHKYIYIYIYIYKND